MTESEFGILKISGERFRNAVELVIGNRAVTIGFERLQNTPRLIEIPLLESGRNRLQFLFASGHGECEEKSECQHREQIISTWDRTCKNIKIAASTRKE